MKQLENDKIEKKTEISAIKEAVFSKEQLSKSRSFKKYSDISQKNSFLKAEALRNIAT